MNKNILISILCVDDEPQVLEGLALHLRRHFQVHCATSGIDGLDILKQNRHIAVIISDMRMPHMDGAAFLSQAKELIPDASRILLTGHTDIDSAISAINKGQIFRFLTKPCPPPILFATIEAAVQQYKLITAERVLLEKTLHGSIKILTDVLALTNPTAFGKATRIKQYVSQLAHTLNLPERWQIEVAAMLSQLGYITLPSEVAEKSYFGQSLNNHEQKMLDKVPVVTEQLLDHIPRLEIVRQILANYNKPAIWSPPKNLSTPEAISAYGCQFLRIAMDFDALEAKNNSDTTAITILQRQKHQYAEPIFNAFMMIYENKQKQADDIREVPLTGLMPGMVFVDDVKIATGALLAARGYEVTESFVERARNFRPGMVQEPLRVLIKSVN